MLGLIDLLTLGEKKSSHDQLRLLSPGCWWWVRQPRKRKRKKSIAFAQGFLILEFWQTKKKQ